VFQPAELPLLPFRTHREALAQWLARHAQHNGDAGDIASVEAIREDFYIREAESGDAHEIMGLLGLIPANREINPDEWRDIHRRFRETDSLQVFVAVARQQPPLVIGFIALSVVRTLTEGRGLINDMAVLPTYQRKGVGAALLEAAMRRADRLNLNYLMVNAERASARVKDFYATLGFADANLMCIKVR
jgi:GNAT superfamily N-acetyltransferase